MKGSTPDAFSFTADGGVRTRLCAVGTGVDVRAIAGVVGWATLDLTWWLFVAPVCAVSAQVGRWRVVLNSVPAVLPKRKLCVVPVVPIRVGPALVVPGTVL